MPPQRKGKTVPATLTAGPLHLLYDNGMLRSVKYNGTEFIRRIYMALRDRHWNTIPYTIISQTIDTTSASFAIRFNAIHDENGIVFSWKGEFRGSSDGTITATLKGTAASSFLRNRIGWCVLHPLPLCKNLLCKVTRTDGAVVRTRFPGSAIAPYQPFPPFSALRYRISDTMECSMSFDGDVFETEDQRNWTDASFKTYSTPQSIPSPVQVNSGDKIIQAISVALSPVQSEKTDTSVIMPKRSDNRSSDNTTRIRPYIGLGITINEVLNRDPASLPQPLPADHLRISIDADHTTHPDLAEKLSAWCIAHQTRLELALYLSENFKEECRRTAEALHSCAPVLERILLLHRETTLTRPGALDAARNAFGHLLGPGSFFTGTDRYFVEINRTDPLELPSSGICFSANPQVHTFDDCIIMENLEGLEEVLHHARTICGERPLALSPLTLRPRKNPLRPEKAGGYDSRQTTDFGAAWLTGVLDVLFRSPLHSCTLFTGLIGRGGLFDENGTPFPLYHVLTSHTYCRTGQWYTP